MSYIRVKYGQIYDWHSGVCECRNRYRSDAWLDEPQ